MHKLESHIFQRLTPWVRARLVHVSSDTLGNTRCRPRLSSQIQAVEDRFRVLHSRIARKIWRDSASAGKWHDSFESWTKLGSAYALNRCLRDTTFSAVWSLWGRMDVNIPDEQDLLDLRPVLADLVVTHVDKLPTDGMIL